MMQRLYMRIYLTTLASLAVVVILCVVLWQFTAARSVEAEQDRFVGALVSKALPPDTKPDALQKALEGIVVPPIEGLVLLDRNGKHIASAGYLGRALTDLDPDASIAIAQPMHRSSAIHAIHLDDGRVVIVRMRTDSLQVHLGGLLLTMMIALAVALGTYPIVRRLTRRLEDLAGTVDRFGHGDLAVRAPSAGNDEVSSLATSFNQMADRVATLLAAHSRMLANASHELRSPLARIRIALELNATNPRPEMLESMRKDCEEIESQIEEILLATVDTALPRDAVDLEVLVAEESSRLDIPFDTIPAEVRGDARLLRRLIRNLLENALKHGGTGVDAKLSIDANGDRILQVGDRGPGIPEAERERIFEPFYRPANTAESGSGWGLGLALVRQIADHHRGSVRCLPREGGGCVFELRLPAADQTN
jgi:signal transduction histidine kinase